jgi:hypothetical protein
MQFWNELEGRTIDGRYPLRRLVRSEGRSAWFETTAGDAQDTPATISLTEALTDADEVTARLQAAQGLKHPNLVSIFKVGQVSFDDTLFVYAIMEHIEQSLSDVLQGQTLSLEEGREVAEALVGALTAVHQQGMSHGHVEAASVLATEETVKLRSDCLQLSPAGQGDDVAGIGTTLFHAFTQRKALTATDAQINRIPAPFAEIVRNSFARRWTLAQVANALKPAPAVSQPMPAPPAPAPPAAIPRPEPIVVKAPVNVAPPVANRPAATAVAVLAQEEPEPERPAGVAKRTPLALYGTLAVIALVIIAWLFFRPSSTPAPASAPQAAVPAPAAPPAPSPAPKPKPAPARSAPSLPPASTGHSVWRVVAYTYKSKQLATDSVARISGEHSDLDASLFSPPKEPGVYLVTFGGAMDHAQALKMLDKARREGLPADTYIQNFSE